MDNDPEQPQRVLDLWFEDANTIFQAENSLFRVHRSLLQARSSVFRDMFTMPHTTNPSDLMDGDIVIHLPDPAEDVRSFFLAIGFDASFFESPPTPTPLRVILAIARLSHKYDVPFLRRRALAHLSARYPTTLNGYLKLKNNSKIEVPSNAEEVEVLKTVLEIDVSWVLPCQFLNIFSRNLHDLLAVQEWKDLEGEIQRMCLLNWRGLEVSMRYEMATLFQTLQSGLCMNCTTWSLKLLKNAVEGFTSSHLDLFMVERRLAPLIQEYCLACRTKSIISVRQAKQSLWDSLPATFDLPPWATLETKKRKDVASKTPT